MFVAIEACRARTIESVQNDFNSSQRASPHPGDPRFDITQGKFGTRIGISQNYLSMMEREKVESGAEILLRISWEFAKSIEWLLTGRE
jgi:DNA-binding XRE family transcriptional regulator